MAEQASPSVNTESIDEALHRLSKKPGVKAWLMLDRVNGAVLKTNGQISTIRPARSIENKNSLPSPTSGSFSADVSTSTDNETQAAQELAGLVWGFLTTAGSLVDEIDSEVGKSSTSTFSGTIKKKPRREDGTNIEWIII
ncbi:uncharacterized protein F4812DRAFT_442755, partial [Daldinia caldariorum]|uniref:uncharacterized protein n=1 Tax=Daldinia caldariorum TaxID=326644 RepID=UPI002007A714